MRNTKQRVAAVKQRAMEINQKKQKQWGHIIGISSAAACLLLITGLSFVMPGIMGKLSNNSYIYSGLSASIFDSNNGLGYLIIALLAFALGISVTILCYRIQLQNKQQDRENNNDRAD